MKKIVCVIVVLVVVSMIAGCQPSTVQPVAEAPEAAQGDSEEASDATSEEESMTIKMGLSMSQMDAVVFHAFADYLETAVIAEGEARGYTVEWTMVNANGDVTKQANDIRDLLSAGCEVVFGQAADAKTILSSVSEVHKAGKIFVMYNREADASATGDQIPDATVNMDSEWQAYGSMVEVFKIMAADGVEPVDIIDVHGDIADQNALNREAGFRKAVKEFGWEDRVVQVVDSGHWEPEVALQNTAAALQAHPDSNCMYVASDWLMSGVQTALENAGKWAPRGEEGHIYLGGTDIYPSGFQYTLDGYMDGNVDVPAWQIAQAAAKSAFDLIEGKEVTKENQLVKGLVINSDNAAQVLEENPHFWGVEYKDME